jgi:hypothetical protein
MERVKLLQESIRGGQAVSDASFGGRFAVIVYEATKRL